MTILLNLSYNTVFGEQLVANFIKGDKPEDIVKQRMNTVNGSEWTCRVNTPEGTDAVSYYYSVEKNGVLSRQEWQLQPHNIKLSASKSESFIAYDHWNDIPEDAYMYSSAITDCVAKRSKSKLAKTTSSQSVIIKTKAPQLRASERLAVMGSEKVLGEWEATKAYPMEEFAPNEWMAVIDAKKLKSNRLEFKFVALNEKIDYTPLWETRDNRIVEIPEMKDGETIVYELDIAFFPIFAWKAAGVVVPIFSLRSEGSFGVGDFGDLKMMVGWAAKTHQRVIQILPIYDTTITNTWTDSYPYNSISIYALHPQYADLRQLPELKDEETRERMETLRKELNALPQIDYERVNNAKREYLRLLFEQEFAATSKKATYKKFFEDNKDWLVPYAAFSHYRDIYGTATFSQWPDHHSLPEDEREKMGTPGTKEYKSVAFWYYIQYILDTQLRDAHSYAQSNRVLLKGDIPIGISRDGVEAWVEPKYFNLNGQAGAPPDAFSANGQNWGFPTYNWDAMLEDGCSWWVRRFRKMAEFFDAYRIDHVLGFFRIWEIPSHAVHGLLGQFAPALAMTKEEIEGYGLRFDEDRYTRPFITDWTLDRIFHENADMVKEKFLDRLDDERYQMKPEFDTQRKVESWYFQMKNEECRMKNENTAQPDSSFYILHSSFNLESLRDGLYALISDVLFLRDHKDPNKFHPRIGVQLDFIYEQLWDNDKYNFNRLYNDYFYRRNNQFWYQEAMKKMPKLTQATRMLVCAEDLGMVPDCVPWVMNQLRILSLEIQSMPKDDTVRFGHLSRNPYRSVCTISTHDMSTLRQWWDEDYERTQDYYNTMLHRGGAAPHPLPGWLAKEIVSRHLTSPSMLCLLSLQDWLSIDENLRLADADAERINIPANPRHYWRYRMHITIEQLLASEDFNKTVKELVKNSGR
ncbi:MAG: 4-alpha-glucanotransferase [Prevotella sp.]|nr:4-alpha-glucanotransferase [Prevotella sp.]